jgi:hypothetical protein
MYERYFTTPRAQLEDAPPKIVPEVQKMKRLFAAVFALALCALAAVPSFADMGPKDQLTVYVENAPSETYYLDLLYKPDDPSQTPYDNMANDDSAYDETMLAALCSRESEGWYPAYVFGTEAPMWGGLTGSGNGGRMVHVFGYFGLPSTYRIIIVTKSGDSFVSDTLTRSSLQSSVTVDYAAKTVSAPSPARMYITQFVCTCVPTLIIEGIIFVLFGYLKRGLSRKRNLLVFLGANVATQLALTATLGTMMIRSGVIGVYLALIPAEAAVAAAEAVVYACALDGYRKRRAVLYAICANACSCAAGFLSIDRLANLLYGLG